MGIEYEKKLARLTDFVTVEEAEGLFGWLLANPKGKLDLSCCEHLHAAVLQALMAFRPHIAVWPANDGLADWLRHAITTM